ncbi:MAG: hypothetical protein NT105_15365 [Verrucomicrobia bacterium]|nr:hypothetical protein [Verrucomicrobiota bacterium]
MPVFTVVKAKTIIFCAITALCFVAAPSRASETAAEDTAREWFMAVLNGKKDRVDGMTRVPFVCMEGVIRTKEQLQQLVLSRIGATKPNEKLADLKPEMIKVKIIAKPKSADPRMAQWLDEAAARVFVEILLGEHKMVLFMTRGNKPKVVGIGK